MDTTDVALAEALGEKEVAEPSPQTLEEEKQTDLKLTEVTEQHLMPGALGSDKPTEKEPSDRKKAPTKGGRAKAA